MTKIYTHTSYIEEEWTYGPDGVTYKTNDPIYNALQQITQDFKEHGALSLIGEILNENEEVFRDLAEEEDKCEEK